MIQDIKGTYRFLWTYKKILIIALLIFIGSAIWGAAMYGLDPAYANQLAQLLQEVTDGLSDQSGFELCKGIFFNNLKASTLGVTFGIIPILFLPGFFTFSNGTLTGAAIAYAAAGTGISPIKLFLVGILPHGIFEIPAILVSFSLGMIMCKEITSIFLRKPRMKMMEMFNHVARVYIIVVLPLLAVAAIVEAYLTPILCNMILI